MGARRPQKSLICRDDIVSFVRGMAGAQGFVRDNRAPDQLRPPHHARSLAAVQMLHWALLVAVFVVVTIHGAAAVLIGALVWAFDLLLRWVYQAGLRNPHMVEVVALPSDVVRVSWDPADFSYAGACVMIACARRRRARRATRL